MPRNLPTGNYTTLRKRIILVDMAPFSNLTGSDESLSIALDSTGVRALRAGGWIERAHGVKKKYVKVHFAVNVKTKEVVAIEATTDEVHDSRVAERLVDGATARGNVKEVLGDGAYDSARIYEHLRQNGIDIVIKPRKNSVLETKSEVRRCEVDLYRCLGHEKWAEKKGYVRRWAVEAAYSTFKRTFGDSVMAKTMANVARGLAAKASV